MTAPNYALNADNTINKTSYQTVYDNAWNNYYNPTGPQSRQTSSTSNIGQLWLPDASNTDLASLFNTSRFGTVGKSNMGDAGYQMNVGDLSDAQKAALGITGTPNDVGIKFTDFTKANWGMELGAKQHPNVLRDYVGPAAAVVGSVLAAGYGIGSLAVAGAAGAGGAGAGVEGAVGAGGVGGTASSELAATIGGLTPEVSSLPSALPALDTLGGSAGGLGSVGSIASGGGGAVADAGSISSSIPNYVAQYGAGGGSATGVGGDLTDLSAINSGGFTSNSGNFLSNLFGGSGNTNYLGIAKDLMGMYSGISGNANKSNIASQAASTSNPGYQYIMDQTMENTMRKAAASGMGLSGNAVGALEANAAGLAAQNYNQQFQNLMQQSQYMQNTSNQNWSAIMQGMGAMSNDWSSIGSSIGSVWDTISGIFGG